MASTENWAVQRINDILATIRANIGAWQQAIVTDLGNSMSWADSSDNLYIGSTQYYIDTGGTSNYVNNDFGQVTLHDSLLVDQTISRSGGADDKIDFTDDSMAFTLGGVLGLTIEDDKIFTALDVGIGIAAPDRELHVWRGSAGAVAAEVDAVGVFESNANCAINLLAPDASTTSIMFGNPGYSNYDGRISYTGSTRNMTFRTASTTKMTLTSDGNLGINTTTPVGLFDVKTNAGGGDDGVDGITLLSPASFPVFSAHRNGNGSAKLDMWSSNGSTHRFSINMSDSEDRILLGTETDSNLRIITNGNDRIFIDGTSGNIGFGLTPAAEILELNGAVLIGDSAGTTNGTVRYSGGDVEARVGGAWVSLTAAATGYWDRDSVNGEVYPSTLTDKVGVGTDAPVSDLQINNSGNDTILLLTNTVTGATATDGGKIWMDSAVLDINNQSSGGTTFSIAGAEKMRIDNSGTSIGIGITNPNFYKDGADTFVIGTTTASADRGMTIVTANDSTGTLAWTDNTSTSPASIAVDHSTDAMTIRTGAATAITIDSSQNVGIGIASTYRLDVSTDALTIGRFVSTEAVGENAPLVKIGRNISATDGDILANFQWVGQNSATTETVFSSITGFATDVTDTTEDGTLIFYNSIAGSLTRMISLDTAVVINDSGADIDFRVEGDTVPNLLVTDAGNDRVGIGLDHPAVFMEIQDPGNNTTLRLSNAASPDRYAQFHATNYGYLNVTTSHSNTRVGINNAGPNYTLDVLGTSGPQIGAVHTDGSVQTTFETNSSGHMTIVPSGSTVNIEANQLRLSHTATVDYADFTVDSDGELSIFPSGGSITLSGDIIIGTSTADTYTLGEEFQAFTTGINVGWAANPATETIYYKKTGKTVLVSVNIEGTSDSDPTKGAMVKITMPFAKDANWRQGVSARTADNGAADDNIPGKVKWISATVIRVYRTFANSGWTNANKKEVEFSFTYQSA